MSKRAGRIKTAVVSVAVVSVLFVLCFFAARSILKTLYPMKYNDFVETYALENDIDINLLYAVIHTESGFDERACSSAGAMGLTQILPETFAWLQTKTGESLEEGSLYEPETAIKYGALFYGILMREYGNVKTAAAAYHAGMGNVSKWLADPEYSSDGETLNSIPIPATASYVKKIVNAMTVYDKLY